MTAAKRVFSNSNNSEVMKWEHYIIADVKRQGYLEAALQWVSASQGVSVDAYMSSHRQYKQITGLESYFRSVIDWVAGTFTMLEKSMRGVEWGRLYETYHNTSYSIDHITERVQALLGDAAVRSKSNIYEYVLGGEVETQILDVRLFDERMKQDAYNRQTDKARAEGRSNCPLCALGNNANKNRIYERREMDADHVTPWSKGGATTLENCQMLCKTHNRAKGNR